LPHSTIFLLDFGNIPTMWYFCFPFYYWPKRSCGLYHHRRRPWETLEDIKGLIRNRKLKDKQYNG